MIEGNDYKENVCAEGDKPLRADRVFLGLTVGEALSLTDTAGYTVEYTRALRGATDMGTPRIVRVRDGVLTAAFFNDTLKEDDI